MKTNTSNNDNIKDMILKAYPDYPDLSCAELWELMDKCLKQGYAKALKDVEKVIDERCKGRREYLTKDTKEVWTIMASVELETFCYELKQSLAKEIK